MSLLLVSALPSSHLHPPRISSLPTLSLALKDLEALVLLGQKPLKRTTAKDPYDRTAYWGRASDPLAAFQKFYTFCFNLAKPLYVLFDSLNYDTFFIPPIPGNPKILTWRSVFTIITSLSLLNPQNRHRQRFGRSSSCPGIL